MSVRPQFCPFRCMLTAERVKICVSDPYPEILKRVGCLTRIWKLRFVRSSSVPVPRFQNLSVHVSYPYHTFKCNPYLSDFRTIFYEVTLTRIKTTQFLTKIRNPYTFQLLLYSRHIFINLKNSGYIKIFTHSSSC